ncbi:MAG: benzoyl-CoA reductase subunit A, partial [Planctomycetes bacterium]|nr:benzoyl-CoA reductase subunit A [Planctomycetota bacterium]
MDCFVGIDLGSTTTKAVIVDTRGRIVGRGITNSRSNYDVAAQVARNEAFTNARFDMLGRALREEGGLGDAGPAFEAALAAAYRHECFLGQLQRLENHCRRDLESDRYTHDRRAMGHALEVILAGIRHDAAAVYGGGTAARSDFFRDLAGASYTEHAAHVAREGGPAFDRLVGLFDRNIIPVENEPETRGFAQLLRSALDRVPLSLAQRRDAVAGLLARVAEADLREVSAVGTGYGRVRLPFPKENIRSEILCHGLGAHLMFPRTRTVLDIGGQDTKAIQVDEHG